MIPLSFAVAAFSVVALVLGGQTRDWAIVGIGVSAGLCAITTFRSQTISTFLKLFVAIFATETIVFGAGYILGKLGYWPTGLNYYKLHESVPMTVALFGVLVYAISFIPGVRAMMRIADLYFTTDERGRARILPPLRIGRSFSLPGIEFGSFERRIATAMVVFLVVLNQAQVAINVRLSFFSRDWFNAIERKDAEAFWELLLFVFTPWAFVYVASNVVEYVSKSMLIIRWRRWLTAHYVGRWLDGSTHYRMGLVDANADNPDQRIAEDVNRFIDGGEVGYGIYSYSILLLSTLSSLVSFSVILWVLSANFTVPGVGTHLPGFLFWVALIYAVFGTVVTHLIGRPLAGLYFIRQRYEADFRFSLARLREYAEQIGLLRGEPTERAMLRRRFRSVMANYIDIVRRRKWLAAFTYTYGQISPIIPYVFAAPFYFGGQITLGIMQQTASAFLRVETALTFFVTYYVTLADFKSVLDRLTSFDAAIERGKHLGTRPPRIEITSHPSQDLEVEGLALRLPQGKQIVNVPSLVLRAGETSLLTGPSGSGKSTFFRALAGIWPFGEGRIVVPDGKSVLLLPQRPYIPAGTLKAALAYPAEPDVYDDAAVTEALTRVKLPHLIPRLAEEAQWAQALSLGEQQRVAIARALLTRPDWLFLDEATAALDEPLEQAMYQLLEEQLPETTIVSIGHRSTLQAFHERRIDMRPSGGLFIPEEQDVRGQRREVAGRKTEVK